MYELAGRYLPVLDPRFIKVITSPEGEVLAFIVAMPELSEGIRKQEEDFFRLEFFIS
jgi:hypothetical protein